MLAGGLPSKAGRNSHMTEASLTDYAITMFVESKKKQRRTVFTYVTLEGVSVLLLEVLPLSPCYLHVALEICPPSFKFQSQQLRLLLWTFPA